MNLNTLKDFRQQLYSCFERSADALFNLSDALPSSSQARSVPELSLSAFFERRWSSVYETLQDGRVNMDRLRKIFVGSSLVSVREDHTCQITSKVVLTKTSHLYNGTVHRKPMYQPSALTDERERA